MEDEEEFTDEVYLNDQLMTLERDNYLLEASTRRKNDPDTTIVGMLELMSNIKDPIEINEKTISKQKEKVEQMISELQLKMQQVTLETPRITEIENKEERLSEDLNVSQEIAGNIRQVKHNVIAQYDLSLGSIINGQANFLCSEKLCKVQMPESYLPQGLNIGSVVTIYIARKADKEKSMLNLILDIQDEVLSYENKNLQERIKLNNLLN